MSRPEGATIKADSAQVHRQGAAAPSVPVKGVWRTIRGFILWSYERGTVQYDVMVTLILLFVFLSPLRINFNDRPVERNPHATGVVVRAAETGGFVYEVDAKAVQGRDDSAIRAQLLSVIEPISGSVSISKYEPVTDKKGRVIAYKVWADRQ